MHPRCAGCPPAWKKISSSKEVVHGAFRNKTIRGRAFASWPVTIGGRQIYFEGTYLYYLVVALLVIVYIALRMLVNSRFGNVIVAIREDPQRAELLGYDVRKYQLVTFVIGSVLAGLSGAIYTSWDQFIAPSSIGLPAAAMLIVWVAFSGRADLTAVLAGAFFILYVFQMITAQSQQAALVLMGAMMLGTVMIAPQGFFVGLTRWITRLQDRRKAAAGKA